MNQLDIVIIFIYFAILAVAVIFVRRAKSIEDFAVGSRSLPTAIVFATLAASLIGPGYSMGVANKAAGQGMVWALIFSAFSVQLLIIGYFIAPRLRKFDKAYTVGDIMGYRYGRAVKLISGLISVILLAGFVGAIARASGDIIFALTGLNFYWALIISTFVVILYSTIGGIKSVILTDVIQFIILALTIPLTILFASKGDINNIVNIVPAELLSIKGKFSTIVFMGLFFSFFFGEMLLPMYTTRALVAKNTREAKRGFMLTGGFSLIWFFLCAVLGILGIALFPESENVYVSMIKEGLPVGITGIAIASLLSIIMSSQSSILNSAAVAINYDVFSVISKKYRSKDRALSTSKWSNFIIGVLAVVFAANVPNVVDALLTCYTLWAPTVVLPFVIGVVYKKAKPVAALSAIIVGGISTGIWEWIFANPFEVPSIVVGILGNQFAFWIVQIFVRNPSNINIFKPTKE
jgi:solute:Na+ symporter, SSS family